MANEHYENASTRTEEQHAQQRVNCKSKAHDMLEALTCSMDSARATLTKALAKIRNKYPDEDIGTLLRWFHLSVLKTIQYRHLESFNVVLGLVGLAIFDSLTYEDKEALRNDLFDNN